MTATPLATSVTKSRALPTQPAEVIYPDSDGKPMADNTRQFDYIVPVEGNIQIRAAPDAMVAFGRPPGYRGSYVQCRENGIAPQVAFEVLSPGNTRAEMRRKLQFYEQYGVEEYYEYDPDRGTLKGWLRRNGQVLYRPDGRRFETFVELEQRAEIERQRADTERQRADTERQRAERLAEQLRALGIDPGIGDGSP